MPLPVITLPVLPDWAQQLANILPLTVLVEFIDVAMKLHLFELNGSNPFWNWPITPTGARLLLSKRDSSSACYLDHADYCGRLLECIDGRYGDRYPSSAPTTVRLCVSSTDITRKVQNNSENFKNGKARTQTLDILCLSPIQPATEKRSRSPRLLQHARRFIWTSLLGWLVWIAITGFSLTAGLYVAASYLLLMPLTGIVVFSLYGGAPRTLPTTSDQHARLVVATSSMNGNNWWAFYGGSCTVNAFLNRPLYRPAQATRFTALARWILRLLIISQWILAVASCTLHSWDALVICFWVFACALATEYGYTPDRNVRDWLRYDCGVKIIRMQAKFSSRRAMLGAIVYLNPDQSRLQWIDPILKDGQERKEWESALMQYIKNSDCEDETLKKKFIWNWILEGVNIGKRLVEELNRVTKTANEGSSTENNKV